MLFSHYTIFPKCWLYPVFIYLLQVVHLFFGTFHNLQLTVTLNLSDVFHMYWLGHVPFLPSFV